MKCKKGAEKVLFIFSLSICMLQMQNTRSLFIGIAWKKHHIAYPFHKVRIRGPCSYEIHSFVISLKSYGHNCSLMYIFALREFTGILMVGMPVHIKWLILQNPGEWQHIFSPVNYLSVACVFQNWHAYFLC